MRLTDEEQAMRAGEFGPLDADDFSLALSALLDGLAVQVALQDPAVGPARAFEVGMRFAAGQLGSEWSGRSLGR